MITLIKSLQAWGHDNFQQVFKSEAQQLDANLLPLQQGLTLSSYVSPSPFSIVILNTSDSKAYIKVRAGIFYTGIIAGCSCADDPTPQDEQNEYCEVDFEINKSSAETSVTLVKQ